MVDVERLLCDEALPVLECAEQGDLEVLVECLNNGVYTRIKTKRKYKDNKGNLKAIVADLDSWIGGAAAHSLKELFGAARPRYLDVARVAAAAVRVDLHSAASAPEIETKLLGHIVAELKEQARAIDHETVVRAARTLGTSAHRTAAIPPVGAVLAGIATSAALPSVAGAALAADAAAVAALASAVLPVGAMAAVAGAGYAAYKQAGPDVAAIVPTVIWIGWLRRRFLHGASAQDDHA